MWWFAEFHCLIWLWTQYLWVLGCLLDKKETFEDVNFGSGKLWFSRVLQTKLIIISDAIVHLICEITELCELNDELDWLDPFICFSVWVSDCFFKQGEWCFALADYQQAEEMMGPDDPAVRLRLAVLHNTLGSFCFQDGSEAHKHIHTEKPREKGHLILFRCIFVSVVVCLHLQAFPGGSWNVFSGHPVQPHSQSVLWEQIKGLPKAPKLEARQTGLDLHADPGSHQWGGQIFISPSRSLTLTFFLMVWSIEIL